MGKRQLRRNRLDKNSPPMPPIQMAVTILERHYARIFAQVDAFHAERDQIKEDNPLVGFDEYWPREAYATPQMVTTIFLDGDIAGLEEEIFQEDGSQHSEAQQAWITLESFAKLMSGCAAWRCGRGVYRFDVSLAEALMQTELNAEIPVTVLKRLPEWAVYIDLKNLPLPSETFSGIDGVMVSYACNVFGGSPAIIPTLLLNFMLSDSTVAWGLCNVTIELPLVEGSSLVQALSLVAGVFEENESATSVKSKLETTKHIADLIVKPILPLILYLCQEEPEIGDGTQLPQKPKPKLMSSGRRKLFQAQQVSQWDIGVRTGAELRRTYVYEPSSSPDSKGRTTGVRPRPHLRQAHWHGYWLGPRVENSERPRRFIVKWLPPILINATSGEHLPAVIHPVETTESNET